MSSPSAKTERQAPRRQLVPRAQREEQMLSVAARLFAERGFNGVSMDEIAELVGITKPMLYAYFDSKEGLYVACIERAGGPLIAAISAAVVPGAPPDQQLWDGMLAFFAFVDDNRALWSTFFVEASARGGAAAAQVTKVRRLITDALGALIARAAIEAGVDASLGTEVDVQAHALLGAAEALAGWWLEHPEASRELLALRLMNFAWMGFGDLLEGNLWLPVSGSSA
jgi:AcrR family transcriptional regulator